MIRVAVVGGSGRMGQTMAAGLSALDDVSVVALVDHHPPAASFGARACAALADLDPASLDVVVDFSSPAGVRDSAAWCAHTGRALVVGATGLGDEERAALARAAAVAPVVVVPNFSVGAVLVERFAAAAAPFFDRVEVIELHHDRKVDAPSGTAIAAARAVAAARERAGRVTPPDPTERATVPGARGALVAGVPVHAVRLPGLVAHQEVLLGAAGEGLTLRHDTYDRASFVAGVALVLRHLPAAGLVDGLGAFLQVGDSPDPW